MATGTKVGEASRQVLQSFLCAEFAAPESPGAKDYPFT